MARRNVAVSNPLNCFSVHLDGIIGEGFYLSLDEERDGGGTYPPHLEIGRMFVLRDRREEQGCFFQRTPHGGLVRSAELVEVLPWKERPFLGRPKTDSPDPLLLVTLQYRDHLLPRRRVTGRAGSSITGTAEIVVADGPRALVRFPNDGDVLHLLCEDISVRSIVRKGEKLISSLVPRPEAMKIRICDAAEKLRNTDDRRERERTLFGLVQLLRLTRPQTRAQYVVIEFLRNRVLPPLVRSAFYFELKRCNELRSDELRDWRKL